MSPQQEHFTDLWSLLQTGPELVKQQSRIELLLSTCQPSSVKNLIQFQNATRLLYSTGKVAHFNHDQLTKFLHPIAQTDPQHS